VSGEGHVRSRAAARSTHVRQQHAHRCPPAHTGFSHTDVNVHERGAGQASALRHTHKEVALGGVKPLGPKAALQDLQQPRKGHPYMSMPAVSAAQTRAAHGWGPVRHNPVVRRDGQDPHQAGALDRHSAHKKGAGSPAAPCATRHAAPSRAGPCCTVCFSLAAMFPSSNMATRTPITALQQGICGHPPPPSFPHMKGPAARCGWWHSGAPDQRASPTHPVSIKQHGGCFSSLLRTRK
jgi:hypothetical protein